MVVFPLAITTEIGYIFDIITLQRKDDVANPFVSKLATAHMYYTQVTTHILC